jgi:polyribonucleotide nucleotidyltransferase
MGNEYAVNLGGSTITLETGKLAGQAGGAVVVRSGDTVVLVTATVSPEPREGVDFLPLSVDYEERLYAAGKIPGGFFKREGRPSEAAILLCRLTDRPLRPLFPKGFHNSIQVIVTALSADQEHYIDILSIIGASAALMISEAPLEAAVGAIRVGYADGELMLNPTASEMENSLLDLRMAGTRDAITMVEAGADEVPEDVLLEALERGHAAMQSVIDLQYRMRAEIGKAKMEVPPVAHNEALAKAVSSIVADRVFSAMVEAGNKQASDAARRALRDEALQALGEEYEEEDIKKAFDDLVTDVVRRKVLTEGIRADGRNLTTVRPISCEVGLLPRAHGSGLFTRGETQVLTIATLGTSRDEQIIDGLGVERSKSFMHHYNFPPYSTGEVRFLRGPRRREIGHGALGERALLPVIPDEDSFPYTIRLVSEVMSSNGSTSQASICASTLALMDTGVPIKAPVAGVAMGLIKQGDDYAILTDILGMEDHLGDMDFKVAGTEAGVTALQMDIKVKGLDQKILRQALEQAHDARMLILGKIREAIGAARPELSPYAPRITVIKVNPDKIGKIIGPGGKTIRRITEETGVTIDVDDDGSVHIASADGSASKRAEQMVRELTEEPEVGKVYNGKVVRITNFGAFVEILPGQDGLVHISQLAEHRVRSVEDIVRLGDEIMVMVIDIAPDGKIKLSRQAVLEGWTAQEARDRDRKPSGNRERSGSSGQRRPSRPPRRDDRPKR